MPQDRDSGASANAWGRLTASRIMATLNATPMAKNSNECIWKGKRIVIKTAGLGVNSVGVSYKMLDRIQSVVAAFRVGKYAYALYELPPKCYSDHMTPTRSTGPANGRVGIVKRSVFLEKGKPLGIVTLTEG